MKDFGSATKLFAYLALGYMVAGLVSGVVYRELTRGVELAGKIQLSTVHTHILVLGMVMSLLFLVLEALFHLNEQKLFKAFVWVYNLGVVGASTLMVVTGLRELWGLGEHPAISGVAGLFHIALTVGFVLFFVVLLKSLKLSK
ncbi:DUF2871 family protein [Gleimia coleocanis]|nr:DUF2871 family protein [Gleimia coleocanis]